jgi:anthranilate/para-aminobenzoate synthase component II
MDVSYNSRELIGICVNDSSFTGYVNTTIQKTVPVACNKELNSTITFAIEWISEPTSCYIAIIPNETTFNSKNCTTFYLYYDGETDGEITEIGDTTYAVNGTKFHNESIETSPNASLVSNYREKNIFVDEISVDSDGNYTVIYKSDQIDYSGEL